MLHRLIRFDTTKLRNADGPRLTDAHDNHHCAAQIHDHHVFRLVLFAFPQFVAREQVGFRSPIAASGPLDGPRFTSCPSTRKNRSGEALTTAQSSHSISPANGAGLTLRSRSYSEIGIDLYGKQQALRQVCLKDIACTNVLDDTFNRLQITIAGEGAGQSKVSGEQVLVVLVCRRKDFQSVQNRIPIRMAAKS